jgi:hypothetical protein
MYRKGLTVKRIADLCGAGPQTVSRHLRVQRAKYPDMDVEQRSNRPPINLKPVGPKWQANIDAMALFLVTSGRYPTKGDPDPADQKLARWLAVQRSAERDGRLPEDRLRTLSALPGWMNDQRVELGKERWLARLEELRVFREAAGRWPRFRDSVDEAERVLGVWLHAQRQNFGRGRLTRDQKKLLNNTVPGWNSWRAKRLTAARRALP